MRAQTPSPKSVPLGTTTPARPGFGGLLNLRMMSWRKRSVVSAVCLSSGKLPKIPRSSSPPKGGFVRMISTRSLSPISLKRKPQTVEWIYSAEIPRPWRSRFIWAKQIRKWFGLTSKDALCLENLPILNGSCIAFPSDCRLLQESLRCRRLGQEWFLQGVDRSLLP